MRQDYALALAERAREISIADPDVAMRRPLRDLVEATLNAAAPSKHTRRSYATAIALFVAYLDAERGDLVGNVDGWRPFVVKDLGDLQVPMSQDTGKVRVQYAYSPVPAALLRLVDAGLVDGFATHRQASGDSINTVTTRIAAVRTFLAVALRDNALTPEQAQNLGLSPFKARRTQSQEPVGRRLSKAEVRALRGAVDIMSVKGKRDLAILDLGLYLGLRQSEIASLKMSDFQQDGGRWWLHVRGKGNKTRRLKVHDVLFKSLLAWCEAAGLAWHDEQLVFRTVGKAGQINHRAITPTDVGRLVAAYGYKAGLAPATGKGRLGSHDLRRTCARNAHDNGASLLQVQKMLGHSDPKTTARYIGLGEDEVDSAVDFVRY